MTLGGHIRTAVAIGIAVGANSALYAQRAEYRRDPGDTLRFHDVTKMDGMVHGAAGDAPFTLTRDATIAFAFGRSESLQAWYERLDVDASGGFGGDKPSAAALLHLPFVLRMEPNGRVQTLKAPTLPRSARLIAQIPPQFDDLFPRLPTSGKPLTRGASWVDTLAKTESDSAGNKFSTRRIAHYRVERDTAINGRPGLLIVTHTEVRIESSVPMQQQPYIAALALNGDENGFAVFSVSEGRMLARERSGELHGKVTYKGAEEPWVVNQSYHYHRLIVAIDPR